MSNPAWKHELRKQSEVSVDRATQDRILARLAKPARRKSWPVFALAFSAGALILPLVWQHLSVEPERTRPMAAHPPQPPVQHFDDHAVGTLVRPNSEVRVLEKTPSLTRVDIARGGVRFDVEATGRQFRVSAGPVEVIVLGTAFTVTRKSTHVTVAVERGRVKVESPERSLVLASGDFKTFDTLLKKEEEFHPPTVTSQATEPLRVRAVTTHPPQPRPPLKQDPPPAELEDPVETLLRFADSARKNQDWQGAIATYDQVQTGYPSDPRSALASLGKGRILLNQLGRPAEAAVAFAQAQKQGLTPQLAKEALNQEITAWHKAGEIVQAKSSAKNYLNRYGKDAASTTILDLAKDP